MRKIYICTTVSEIRNPLYSVLMLADEQTLKFSRFRHENAAVVFVTRQAV